MSRRGCRAQHRLDHLTPEVQRDLLRVLASPSDVRADLIRQMYERPDTRDLAEVLMDLEADPAMRLQVMQVLTRVKGNQLKRTT